MRRVQSSRSFFSRFKSKWIHFLFSQWGTWTHNPCLVRWTHFDSDVFLLWCYTFNAGCRSMSLDTKPSLDSTHLIVNVMAKIKMLAKWYSKSAKSTELSPFCRKGTSLWWIQDDEQRELAPATKLAGVDRGGLPGGCQDITRRSVGEEQCAGPAGDARGRGIRVEEQRRNLIYCKKKN